MSQPVQKIKKNSEKNEVTLFVKIIFAIAAGPSQMYLSVINTFSTVFLLEVVKLSPARTSIILFTSKVFDALTDPIYGILIDKTKPIKFGKLKVWILISFPLTGLSYLMFWFNPFSVENSKFIWFLIWNCLFYTFITGVRLPLVPLIRNLTKSNTERDFITTLKIGFELVGVIVGIIIQTPFSSVSQCKRLNQSLIESLETNNKNESYFENKNLNLSTSFWNENQYFIAALILTFLFVLSQLALILFVKEKYEEEEDDDEEFNDSGIAKRYKANALIEFKRMITFKPFVILSICSFLSTFGVQIIQSQMQLYFQFGYTAISNLFSYAVIGILALSILVVPLWQFLMKKIGKKLCVIIGCSSILPLAIGFLFFKTNALSEIIIFFSFIVIGASCFTVTILVPWAMLPECLDHYYLKYRSKSDAIFISFFIIGPKILMAIYLGISQFVLSRVGYKNGICSEDQNEYVNLSVKLLISIIPTISFLISVISIYFYTIDESQAKQNSEAIKKMKLKMKISSKNQFRRSRIDSESNEEVRF